MIIDISLKTPESSFLNFDSLGKSNSFKMYTKGINKLKKYIDSISKDDKSAYSISDYLLVDNTQYYCSFILNIHIESMKEKQIQKIKDLIHNNIFDTIAYRNKIFSVKIIQKHENDILYIGFIFI